VHLFCQDLQVCEVQRLVPDISPTTIVSWFKKLREICSEEIDKVPMFGEVDTNSIIEIDESCFGKKNKYNRGRRTKKYWVFGMAQRDHRHTYFKVVPNRKNETLLPIITGRVTQGSTIFHDDWVGYRKLHDLGFKHGAVVHKNEFVSAEGVCTNLIEGKKHILLFIQ